MLISMNGTGIKLCCHSLQRSVTSIRRYKKNVRLTTAVKMCKLKSSQNQIFKKKLFDAGIIVDKSSGSTTEITQALDAGPLFITKNNYLKEIKDEDV